jgi:hypothetical protein
MIYFILRLIFFYILFLFVKSLLKAFIRGKIKSSLGGFDIPSAEQRTGQDQAPGHAQANNKDVIEAEFRKL